MRRPLAILALILAWLCANGAVWDVAQVFAWSRMFTGYAHALPMSDALRETLDPLKPCPLCQAIAKAKGDSGKRSAATVEQVAKIVLVVEASANPVISPRPDRWASVVVSTECSWSEPVPVPPPRASVDEI